MSNRLFICGKKKLNCVIEETRENLISEINLEEKGLDTEPIKFVISGIYHNFIVTENDKVYTFGGNHFGQLGLGDTDDRSTLTELEHESLQNKRILEISGRACFVGIATDKNEVFLFGLNNFGQLGSGHSKNLNVPTKINVPSLELYQYAKLCCAGVHTVIVTGNNEIWVCGYNTYGQLGINTKDDSFKPVELTVFKEKGKVIKDVICGDYHSIFHTEEGELWSCGKNTQGQLGLDDTNPRTTPHRIKFFELMNITHVSCGENHSIVIVDNNQVYGFGTNTRGQLGLTDTKTNVKIPTLIKLPTTSDIKILQCGRNFTVLVTVDDEIVVFGDNNTGQLGIAKPDDMLLSYVKNPQILPFDERGDKTITAVSCGEYHSMFLCSDIPKPVNRKAIIESLCSMLKYGEEHESLFDGEVHCTDGTVKVFYGLIKERCPSLYANASGKSIKVDLSMDVFYILLSYLYTDDINNVEFKMESVIELYARASEFKFDKGLVNQLLIYLISVCDDTTVVNMLLSLEAKNSTPLPLRKYLVLYLKKAFIDGFDKLVNGDQALTNPKIMREVASTDHRDSMLSVKELARELPDSTIEQDLLKLYEAQEGDFKIWIDPNHTEYVTVHKCLLAFRVNKYMAQFTSGMLDENLTELDFFADFYGREETVTPKHLRLLAVMKDVLKFLYTSTMEVTFENAISIIELWDWLDMPMNHEIYGMAMRKIMNNMNKDNVLNILRLFVQGRSDHFPQLEQCCLATGAKYWRDLNDELGDDIMNYVSYAQYVKINRAFMKLTDVSPEITHRETEESQSDPASANK